MVRRLLNIYIKSINTNKKDGIAFTRCDYYNDLDGLPKLTEYNIMSVGMQSHQEKYQDAKKHTDYDQRHLYAECATINSFATTVQEFLKAKNIRGILLFVVFNGESNLFDQKRL